MTALGRLALAFWFWLAAAAGLAIVAWANGGDRGELARAAVLAMAPALAGFILLPRLGQRRVDAGLIAAWLLAMTGLVAGTGGASSPLAAGLAIAPALALALCRRWAPEAGAAAVLGYALAAAAAAFYPSEASALGAYPELLSVAALAFAAGLMALGQSAPAQSQVMGRRIAEVSHELRTPLTHILGFSEMIERQMFGETSARYVEYAGLIRRSGAHLLALVNDLLDLSKIEAGRYDLEIELFDARGVIEEVIRLASDSAKKKSIAMGMVTPESALMARADMRALKRILLNTIGNAVKFTPEGGRVMVIAAAVDGDVVIDTVDNGPGIPPEERAQLGQAYLRGSSGEYTEGTGLGLALVRALAELHGGTLSFHDAPGGGALVRVALPVVAPS